MVSSAIWDICRMSNTMQPRVKRHDCDWPAMCFAPDGRSIAARVRNVSEHGMKLEGNLGLFEGEAIQLCLDQIGVFDCRVVWSKKQSAGVQILDEHNLSESDVSEICHSVISSAESRSFEQPRSEHFQPRPQPISNREISSAAVGPTFPQNKTIWHKLAQVSRTVWTKFDTKFAALIKNS